MRSPVDGTRSGPFPLAEPRPAPSVGVDAVDLDLVRPDHPVDVNEALVAALGGNLLGRQVAAIDKTFRIALAERDVAGRALREKGVEEKQTPFPDWAGNAH